MWTRSTSSLTEREPSRKRLDQCEAHGIGQRREGCYIHVCVYTHSPIWKSTATQGCAGSLTNCPFRETPSPGCADASPPLRLRLLCSDEALAALARIRTRSVGHSRRAAVARAGRALDGASAIPAGVPHPGDPRRLHGRPASRPVRHRPVGREHQTVGVSAVQPRLVRTTPWISRTGCSCSWSACSSACCSTNFSNGATRRPREAPNAGTPRPNERCASASRSPWLFSAPSASSAF